VLLFGFENSNVKQEFMILPTGASSFSEAMAMGCEVYHHLAKVTDHTTKGNHVSLKSGYIQLCMGLAEATD
jgi:enolase